MAPCSLFWSLWIPIWPIKTLQKLIEASVASAGSMCDQWSGSVDKQLHTSHSGSLIRWSVIICYLSRSNEREKLQLLQTLWDPDSPQMKCQHMSQSTLVSVVLLRSKKEEEASAEQTTFKKICLRSNSVHRLRVHYSGGTSEITTHLRCAS